MTSTTCWGAILGYADLIRLTNLDAGGDPVDDQLNKRVESIITASNRASLLVNQLLAFSRRGKFRNIRVDMHSLLCETADLLRPTLPNGITMSRRLDAKSACVLGDPVQMQSIILNLICNARDAMPAGGRLTLATRNRVFTREHTVAGQWRPAAGRYLMLLVRDTGIGMDETTRKRMFEPFFTTKAPGKGHGLGLAGVYGTVKSHHGAIDVQSSPGSGTTLTVYLPLSGESDDVVPESEPVNSTGTGGR